MAAKCLQPVRFRQTAQVSSDAARSASSREAVFAQPFHPPTLVSHSTAVSHRRLLQWKENSSAPAHDSYRPSTAAQLLEDFRDQIASHRERYLAWIECQSIGWIAAPVTFLVSCTSSGSTGFPSRSVPPRQRSGTGATLPSAIRTSSSHFGRAAAKPSQTPLHTLSRDLSLASATFRA